MLSDKIMACRVCGLLQADPPWGANGLKPSFNICPCCGTEFGYDDATLSSVRRKRAAWQQGGGDWFIATQKPENWSFAKQAQNIPSAYAEPET